MNDHSWLSWIWWIKTINYGSQTKLGRHIVFAPFLIKPQDEVWWLIVFAPFLIIKSSNEVLGNSCFCTVSSSSYYYYYYITLTVVEWCIAILRFFFTIIIIIIIIIPHVYVRSISRRCLDQTLWNLVGISYAMWSCAVKGWFFQNGNGQNAKTLKNTKNDHSRLLAKQKLMKLDRKNIHN